MKKRRIRKLICIIVCLLFVAFSSTGCALIIGGLALLGSEEENTFSEEQTMDDTEMDSFPEEIITEESTPTETSEPDAVEIVFRNMPWGMTSQEAEQLLLQDVGSSWIWEKSYMLYPETMLSKLSFSGVVEGGNTLYAYGLTAGGYDVSLAQLFFAYSVQDGVIDRDSDSLYAAVYFLDTVEHEAVYEDLQQKLTVLYGEGREESKTQSGWMAASDFSGEIRYEIKETTWYGVNDTFVTLQWASSSNQADSIQSNCGVAMLYGKTDAKSMLKDLERALEMEKAELDKKNARGNSDGL